MDYASYQSLLEERLQRNFDLERDYIYRDMKLDLLAKYYVRNEKYVFTKKATIYAFENNELCMIKHFHRINPEGLHQYTELLKSAVGDFVNSHDEHMSTLITGVIVVDEIPDPEIPKQVKKFKFHKSFAFGFKGWVDVALVLVSLKQNEVITNKKGREVEKAYRL
ncbi:hypothetical protein [Geosporobacter ferrireducens]|uniref:DUF8052 domain-containing protein n=1 Tax=Geosporobacter ferrireducens TaxID=1424294 RepID=A0A1D8GKH9_9FIRM|nr:hypothetical protein [Geosporobacter ferrireducens]AOT71405.1 hypothetical protein Gferi_18860 [Geosporobacter ferrireducens]MTI57710.1 hypothetical protein [Geosporobacter ferrireducens]